MLCAAWSPWSGAASEVPRRPRRVTSTNPEYMFREPMSLVSYSTDVWLESSLVYIYMRVSDSFSEWTESVFARCLQGDHLFMR